MFHFRRPVISSFRHLGIPRRRGRRIILPNIRSTYSGRWRKLLDWRAAAWPRDEVTARCEGQHLRDCTGETGGENCVVASFELSDATEFKRWLLGFGRHAVVLTPRPFASEMAEELARAIAGYSPRIGVAS